MTLTAFLALVEANAGTIFAIWIIFEQYLAANPKLKANSTLQLVVGALSVLVRKLASNKAPK